MGLMISPLQVTKPILFILQHINFMAEVEVFTRPWGLQLLRYRMEKLACKMWLNSAIHSMESQ